MKKSERKFQQHYNLENKLLKSPYTKKQNEKEFKHIIRKNMKNQLNSEKISVKNLETQKINR